MELAQCIESVYAVEGDVVTVRNRLLFKKGFVYPIFRDRDLWMATDEEGERHIVADSGSHVEDDSWFSMHFRSL